MSGKRINENVIKSEDDYYTQVSDNNRWLKVKHVLEILDNLPKGAYSNPAIASSLPSKIFGYVNGVSEQTNRFGKKYVQFTIAPYANGSRRRDFSAGAEGEPLHAVEIKEQLLKFNQNELVLVKQLDWRNGLDVVLIPFTSILASRSDGVFLRLETPCEKIKDNAANAVDFGMNIAQAMKHRDEPEGLGMDESCAAGNNLKGKTNYTKKQIRESIRYWQKILENLNEDSNNDFNQLLSIAKYVDPTAAAVALKASKSINDSENLDEGTASGVVMGVLGTLLAINIMCNVVDKLPGQVSKIGPSGAELAEDSYTFVDHLQDYLNNVKDSIHAICVRNGIQDHSVEDLVNKMEIDAEFEKIMAEK